MILRASILALMLAASTAFAQDAISMLADIPEQEGLICEHQFFDKSLTFPAGKVCSGSMLCQNGVGTQVDTSGLYSTSPISPVVSAISIEIWAKFPSNAVQGIASTGGGALQWGPDIHYRGDLATKNLRFNVYGDSGSGTYLSYEITNLTARCDPTTWTHYVCQFDYPTTNAWMYVNGVGGLVSPIGSSGVVRGGTNLTFYFGTSLSRTAQVGSQFAHLLIYGRIRSSNSVFTTAMRGPIP